MGSQGVKQLRLEFPKQGIILPPKVHEDDEPEYIGMWHVDGHREDVAAVVLHPGYIKKTSKGSIDADDFKG